MRSHVDLSSLIKRCTQFPGRRLPMQAETGREMVLEGKGAEGCGRTFAEVRLARCGREKVSISRLM